MSFEESADEIGNDPWLVERGEYMDKIDLALQTEGLCIITGYAGSGKTTLARLYGKKKKADAKIKVQFVRKGTMPNLLQALQLVSGELGIDDKSIDAAVKNNVQKHCRELTKLVYNQLMRMGQQLVIILDNLQDKTVLEDCDQYRNGRAVQIIVTTRNYYAFLDHKDSQIILSTFTHEEGQWYLRNRLVDRMDQDEDKFNEDVDQLLSTVGLTPRQLEFASGYIRENPTTSIDEYVKLSRTPDPPDNILPALQLGFEEVSPQPQQLLRYGAELETGYIPFGLLEQLLGVNRAELHRNIVNPLECLSLVTEGGNGLGVKIYEEVHKSCVRYTEWKEEAVMSQKILSALSEKMPFVNSVGDEDWREAEMYAPHAIKIVKGAEDSLGNDESLARVLLCMGRYEYVLYNSGSGDVQKALGYYEKAIKMRQDLFGNKPHADVADSLNDIGNAHYNLGEIRKGLEYHEKALKMRQEIYGNKPHSDVADSLNDIGNAHYNLGDIRKGLGYYEQALAMQQQLYEDKPHPLIAQSLHYVGVAYRDLGETDKGEEYQKRASEMNQQLSGEKPHARVALSPNIISDGIKKAPDEEQEEIVQKKAPISANQPSTTEFDFFDLGANAMFDLNDPIYKATNELEEYLQKKKNEFPQHDEYIDGILFYLEKASTSSLDEDVRAITKTQLLNKLYAVLGVPKVMKRNNDANVPFDEDQELRRLSCKTVLTIEDRSDLLNRACYFEVLEIAVQSEKKDFVMLAMEKITDILSRAGKDEMQHLCLQMLSWTDILVKTCTGTFRSSGEIQIYFFRIISDVTTSTKLEYLPAKTVDAITQHIIDRLDSGHNEDEELLIKNISDASVALFESVQVNRKACELIVESFLKVLPYWLENRTILSKILDVVIACQQHQIKDVVTEEYNRLIIKAMEKHADISDIQERGCKVSRYFFDGGGTLQETSDTEAFGEKFAVFYQAIMKFSDNEHVVVDGLFCLNSLAAMPSHNPSTVNVSNVLTLFRNMSDKLENPEVASQCLSLLHFVLGVLAESSDLMPNQANDVASYLINVMKLYPYRPGIQEKGLFSICLLMEHDQDGNIGANMFDEFRTLVVEAARTFPTQCGKYHDQFFATFGQSPSRPSGSDGGNNVTNPDPTNGGEGNQDDSGPTDQDNEGDTNGGDDEFGSKDGNQDNNDHEKWQERGGKVYRVGGFDLHFLQASPLARMLGPDQLLTIRRLDLEQVRQKFNETAEETGIGVTYKIATAKQFRTCLTSPNVHLLHLWGHGSPPNQQDQTPPLLLLESDGWGMVHPHGPEDIFSYLCGNQPQTVKFVFVSTCHSRSIGDKLVACGIPHVICCCSTLHEEIGAFFQDSFYRALACGLTVREAFERAKRETRLSRIMDENRLEAEVDKYCLLPENDEHSYKPSEARWEVQHSISSSVLDESNLKCPPTRVEFFKGREEEQCRILQYLRDHRIVRVVGENGVGKKATARTVCEFVRMRCDLVDINTILWFGDECISPDETLEERFLVLCEHETPDADTRKATKEILKHVANRKVLFVIECEFHDTMKHFLSTLKRKTGAHRAILIEPGREEIDNEQVGTTIVRGGHQHKIVSIRELDVESSVSLYSACKYAKFDGRDSFFNGIKTVYNRKPVLQGLILDLIGGQKPQQIIEAAESDDKITYQNLLNLLNLTDENFGLDWDVCCRTELEHLLENIEKVRKNAVKFENQNMAASLQWVRHELAKQRTRFPKFDDMIESYQEMKEQREQAKERLMDAFEGRGEQEHLELHEQDLELQSLADKLVAEAKAQVLDEQNFHQKFPTLDDLDTQLRAAVLSAYSQCNDLLGEQIRREIERIERAEIRFACVKELQGLENRLFSVKEKAEKRRDNESVQKLNDLHRRVNNAKEARTDVLLALTTALPFFVNNLISRTENYWAANPIPERQEQQEPVPTIGVASGGAAEEDVETNDGDSPNDSTSQQAQGNQEDVTDSPTSGANTNGDDASKTSTSNADRTNDDSNKPTSTNEDGPNNATSILEPKSKKIFGRFLSNRVASRGKQMVLWAVIQVAAYAVKVALKG